MHFTLVLMMLSSLFAYSDEISPDNVPFKAKSALIQLEKDSGGTLAVSWNPETSTPASLSGKLTRPSKYTPEWIAYSFLTKYRALYGIKEPPTDIKVTNIKRNQEGTRIELQRMMFDTPVYEDILTIVIDQSGVVRKVEGVVHPNLEKKLFNRAMQPAYSDRQAIAAASVAVQDTQVKAPEVKRYYLASRKGTPLVYFVTLYTNRSDPYEIMVHSLTGRIIHQK